MANKFKKLLVLGSTVSALFMAIAACNFKDQPNSNQTSSQQTSTSDNSSESSIKAAELVSISVTNNKNEYERNEQLSLVVTANYDDGTTTEVTDYQVSNFDSSVIGEQVVTVSYKGQTATLNVFVKQPTLVNITASGNNTCEWGEQLDLVVTANYSDGSSEEVNNYQVNGFNSQVSGDQDVVITYEGMTTSLKVKVNDPIIVNLKVEGQKQTYEYDEQLNLVVTATYSDGNTVVITDYTVEGFDSKNPGNQTVVISYEGKTTAFNVKVNKPALTNLDVAGNKNTYEWGEQLDLVVTASYADNSSKEVTDYTIEGFDSSKPGNQTVTVTYEGKSVSFDVKVNNPALTGITAASKKDSYNYGERLKLTVVASYADGSKVEVTNYQVSGYNSKEAGVQTITVTFEGKTCTLDIVVNECFLTFPTEKMNEFLLSQNITSEIPAPAGYLEWTDSVEKEQDGSKYFYATIEDEGEVGSDSLADQYAVILENEGWTVRNNNNTFSATKDGGDAEVVFATYKGVFSVSVYAYVEFPDTKPVANVAYSKLSLNDGDVIVLGNIEQEVVVTGFENGSLKTATTACDEKGIKTLPRNAWRFTLHKNDSKWTLTDVNGRKLGAKGLNQLCWDTGSTEWTFLMNGKTTNIINSNRDYGRLCYNAEKGTISTVKSDSSNNIYPQIFKVSEADVVYPTSIALSGREEVGTKRTNKLAVEYIPENSNSINEVDWSSSDESIATVDRKGVVTGVSEGQATITARTKSRNQVLETTFVVEVKEQILDSWTVMIYMCGSDLESGSYHFATSDIREILSVTGQPDDVNVIIETGGSRKWSYPGIDASMLSRYHVANNELVLDEKVAKASMGKQSTFEDFLNWGLQEYPAYKTGVVFWNHGGALGGCCYDENYNSDSLLNSEANAAFANAFEEQGLTGSKLEFVGYDCCLMQIQDVAEFNSQYFNYMVGSEEAEDGYGWDYDNWLDDLYAGKDTEAILKANCDSFVVSCGVTSDQCLSYLKLNKMADFHEKLEDMASAIKNTVKSNWNTFKNVINSSKTYTSFWSYGVMDGLDFLNKLGANSSFSSFSSQINDAKDAYNALVGYCRKGSKAGNTTGLAFIANIGYVTYNLSETNFVNWRSLFY